jgi:hypothetical protein
MLHDCYALYKSNQSINVNKLGELHDETNPDKKP